MKKANKKVNLELEILELEAKVAPIECGSIGEEGGSQTKFNGAEC